MAGDGCGGVNRLVCFDVPRLGLPPRAVLHHLKVLSKMFIILISNYLSIIIIRFRPVVVL